MESNTVNVTELIEKVRELEKWKGGLDVNLDHFFLITVSLLIYFMQCGFAFLEAGSVRSKNVTNILIKNLLDSFVSGLSYWIIGYALAFGDGSSKFIGECYFAHADLPEAKYAHWFFQYVFAATAATIVSGAVAERCDFNGYLVYSFLITGFVYPVVTHWTWYENGWLTAGQKYIDDNGNGIEVGYKDFAGSGVVHALGGTAAFIGAFMLGPRKGRFDESGFVNDLKGHSIPFAALGGFILLFGFFAFNGGSQGSISNEGDGIKIAIAITNTVVAATGGGFITLALNKTGLVGDGKWSLLTTVNGCLTGMVSACAGCDDMYTWGAFITGLFGGIMYMLVTWTVLKLKVDDPLDATAVHLGGGVTGVIAVAFFSKEYGILLRGNRVSGLHLAWQLAGLACIVGWTAALCLLIFGGLKLIGMLRVDEEMEMKGLDIPKHGEPAYPAESYGHGWGEKGDSLAQMAGMSVMSKQKTDNMMKKREMTRPTGNAEVDALRKLEKSNQVHVSVDSGINNGIETHLENTQF